jgi:hypothetical protein
MQQRAHLADYCAFTAAFIAHDAKTQRTFQFSLRLGLFAPSR